MRRGPRPQEADVVDQEFQQALVVRPSGQWWRTGSAVSPHSVLRNLFRGRIENSSEQGALITKHRICRPGALHRANGRSYAGARGPSNCWGEPFVWEP